jgi:hypothetical protein
MTQSDRFLGQASEAVRVTLLTSACEYLAPSIVRGIAYRIARKMPERNNWSERPNIYDEVKDFLTNCDDAKVYKIIEAVYSFMIENHNENAGRFQDEINECFADEDARLTFEAGKVCQTGKTLATSSSVRQDDTKEPLLDDVNEHGSNSSSERGLSAYTASDDTPRVIHAPIKTLLSLGDNAENVRQLVVHLVSPGGIVPFVGAGLSAPFNFPLWTSFLMDQASKIGQKKTVKTMLDSGKYEEAAELIETERTPTVFHQAMRGAFGKHKLPTEPIRVGAISLLPALSDGPVLTTNFDGLLEAVYGFENVIEGAQADRIASLMNERKRGLLKMHGSFDERSSRVLTKTEYDLHYGASGGVIDAQKPLPRLLAHILTGHRLLFVGCSLNGDRTVLTLREVARRSPETYHFAIVEMPRSTKMQIARGKQLGAAGILPIWYPAGEHDTVELILDHLVQERSSPP